MPFVKDKSARAHEVRALAGLRNKDAIKTLNGIFRCPAKPHIRTINEINYLLEKKGVFSGDTITDFHAS